MGGGSHAWVSWGDAAGRGVPSVQGRWWWGGGVCWVVVRGGGGWGGARGMGRFEELVNSGLVAIDGFGVGRTAGAVGAVVAGVGVVAASALKGKLREAGVAKEALAAGDEEAKAQGRVPIHEPLVELQILGGRLRPKWVCC